MRDIMRRCGPTASLPPFWQSPPAALPSGSFVWPARGNVIKINHNMVNRSARLGRPSSYTTEIADEICARLAGGASLTSLCKLPEFPNEDTVYNWLKLFPEFSEKYTRAREAQADTLADQILDISDEKPPLVANGDGDPRVDPGFVQWQRGRVEARKWTAAKLRPKKYGDKVTQEHTGADGGPVVYRFED